MAGASANDFGHERRDQTSKGYKYGRDIRSIVQKHVCFDQIREREAIFFHPSRIGYSVASLHQKTNDGG